MYIAVHIFPFYSGSNSTILSLNLWYFIHHEFFALNRFIYLFIYLFNFWLCWVFLAAHGPSLVAVSGSYSAILLCGVRASHCAGPSRCGAQALGMRASAVAAHGLSRCGSRAPEHRLSSHGTWAHLLHGMWDLPRPGLEPVFEGDSSRVSRRIPSCWATREVPE